MYSQELEDLISVLVETGEVTEKKREIILKRGEAEGIDRDELDLYLDAMILKNKKKESIQKPETVHSIETLRELLKKAVEEGEAKKAAKSAMKRMFSTDVEDEKCKVLRNFTVPTERDDLLEFTIAVKSDKNNEEYEDVAVAYNELYQACLQTIRAHYKNDPAFKDILRNANWKAGLKAFKEFFDD